MGHYRKVETRIHADEKYRKLSDRGKLLFLTVLTHENMTSLGAMKAYPAAMAAELNWTLKQYDDAFAECAKVRILAADPFCGFLWAVNFLRYNPPENPNVVAGWSKALDKIPECKLRNELIDQVRAYLEPFPDGYRNRFGTVPKPLPSQEPEQEPEPEPDKKRASSKDAGEGFAEFWSAYPRKVGKGKATEAWANSHGKRPPLADILAAIEEAKSSHQWTKDNGQFIPNPATWLNQSRWDDSLPGSSGKKQTAPPEFGSLIAGIDEQLAWDGRQYLTASEWVQLHPEIGLPPGLRRSAEAA